jgi:MFS family permease
MSDVVQAGRQASWQVPVAALAAALLFNLGQGVLRPTLPLYLQQVFAANYQMVTVIPLVFGVGKWVASLPTGYLLDRLERRRLMVGGLLVIAIRDVGSLMTSAYGVFLGLRALADLPTALIGDRVAPSLQGVAIGWLRTMTDSGHILGGPSGDGSTGRYGASLHAVPLGGGPPDGDDMAVPSAGIASTSSRSIDGYSAFNAAWMSGRTGVWGWGMPMAVTCRGAIREVRTVLNR